MSPRKARAGSIDWALWMSPLPSRAASLLTNSAGVFRGGAEAPRVSYTWMWDFPGRAARRAGSCRYGGMNARAADGDRGRDGCFAGLGTSGSRIGHQPQPGAAAAASDNAGDAGPVVSIQATAVPIGGTSHDSGAGNFFITTTSGRLGCSAKRSPAGCAVKPSACVMSRAPACRNSGPPRD
jgi:hypothetical protein